MRLINTTTLALEEFSDQTPPYAILSHTWEEEEVSFEDWADRASASQKKGYKKICDTCRLAKRHGYKYLWVDTNCIDKSSSAELSEAINSMFNWYRYSRICYVYLSDVPTVGGGSSEKFRQSRWFTRGWTLQELLAPRDIEFYSCDWSLLGTKESLCSDISLVTGIDSKYIWQKDVGKPYLITGSEPGFIVRSIEYATPANQASVAERFSWLSSRKTTRPEDMAYCMLGIFGLNMPLLYGEGWRAFLRLQEEIMKVSDDQSLFCWTSTQLNDRGSFLSAHPSGFAGSSYFLPTPEARASPYSITNTGLSITLPILHCWDPFSFIVVLQVNSVGDGTTFGLPMYGSLETGRVYRRSSPPEPIHLGDGVSGSQQLKLFVSEKHSQLYKSQRRFSHRRDPERFCFGDSSAINYGAAYEQAGPWAIPYFYNSTALILTFEPRNIVNDITTGPTARFDPTWSCIVVENVKEQPPATEHALQVSCSVGVLLDVKLISGEVTSLMISSSISRVGKDKTLHWARHCWRVHPEDAAILRSRVFQGSCPEIDRARKAIVDANFAQSIDFKGGQSGFSVSMAKKYSRLNGGALCHMHLSWNPSLVTNKSQAADDNQNGNPPSPIHSQPSPFGNQYGPYGNPFVPHGSPYNPYGYPYDQYGNQPNPYGNQPGPSLYQNFHAPDPYAHTPGPYKDQPGPYNNQYGLFGNQQFGY